LLIWSVFGRWLTVIFTPVLMQEFAQIGIDIGTEWYIQCNPFKNVVALSVISRVNNRRESIKLPYSVSKKIL